ncbi:DUF2254 domain-containing protein [Microbacterium esteraromaticum]|uniref:DUF2254 domain-containing protein n=1 Tax=Microbacterium esteraromaticum TaxID=57043 RepID=UPI003C2F9D95
MRSWYLRARESFWFVPALFALGAVALALALIEVDRLLLENGMAVPLATGGPSATGGRAILTVIGGTMLGVAATSFSITIAVLATASSTYGPRLVRNFMADRGNQVVLAVLTSTFLYTLVVLRAVRTEQDSSDAFVPALAVGFAVVLAVCDVAVLVYFIHHIARSVQVTTLQARVSDELMAAIDLLYPSERERTEDAVEFAGLRAAGVVTAARAGYVQHVDLPALTEYARQVDALIQVLAPPGRHVLAGDALARVLHSSEHNVDPGADRLERTVRAAITIERYRTPQQDLRYAAQGLTETGIRGLGSGTNDPYTAVSAIDALGVALTELFRRPPAATVHSDASGRARVLCAWPTPTQVLADVMLALRTYAMGHPLAVHAAIRMLMRIEAVAVGENRRALRDEVAAFRQAYLAASPTTVDTTPIVASLDGLITRVDAARA